MIDQQQLAALTEQFKSKFKNEWDCCDFLFAYKWPDGFFCPKCGHDKAYTVASRRTPLYQCAICHHQSSLFTGTIMEKSRTGVMKWLQAIHLAAEHPEGISAHALADVIKVTYKTAWHMLHKIRCAMGERVRPEDHFNVRNANTAGSNERTKPKADQRIWEMNEWIGGQYRGVGARYRQAYIAEYAYRFNSRIKPIRLFERLLFVCMTNEVVTYKQLTETEEGEGFE